MYGIDINKVIEMFIKYRTQVIYVSAGLGLGLIFFIGRLSVDAPKKEVICKHEIETKDKLFEQLAECRNSAIKRLRVQRDEDENSCIKRIAKAIKDTQQEGKEVDCETIRALAPQCKGK